MSILQVDFEIETFSPYISYPSLQDFLAGLDDAEPHCCWSENFLGPLTRMGVQSLDNIDLATPESLYVFHRLPPIMIMELFIHILEVVQSIHQAYWRAVGWCADLTWNDQCSTVCVPALQVLHASALLVLTLLTNQCICIDLFQLPVAASFVSLFFYILSDAVVISLR